MKKMTLFLLFAVATGAGWSSEKPEKPIWAGNKLGYEALGPDYIDPDHAPLLVSGDTVMSGNKKMALDKFGFPRTSSWRDYQILRAPVYLKLDSAVLRPGRFTLEKVGKNSALGKAVFEADGLRFDVTSKFDFDFTIRYTVTVTPLKEAVTVKQLSLVFPMNTKANAEKLVMYYTEGPDRLESGLEAQKRRVHLTLKGGDARKIEPGFCSIFWVGTTYWGLSWNFESAKNWLAVKGSELTYDPVSGDFVMNWIDKPSTIRGKLTYEFFLTPTPVKNMPKNWRAWNYNWRGTTAQTFDRTLFNQLIYWSSIWRGFGYNPLGIRNPEEVRKAAAMDKGMNKANYYIPQLNTTTEVFEDDEGNMFVLEDKYLEKLCEKYIRWSGPPPKKPEIPSDAVYFKSVEERNRKIGPQITPNKKYNARGRTWDVVYAPPLADHMVYALNEFIKLGVGGIYYDGINPQHTYAAWAAWTDSDGDKRPVFHFEWQRELLKRMRHLVKKNDKNEMVTAHQSGTRPASTLSLCDVIIPGETFHYTYHEPEKRDTSPSSEFYYAHIVGDIDNLKGEFFHRQWGVPHILIPEVTSCIRKPGPNKVTKGTRTMLAYTLHFDMLYHPTMCDVNEIYKFYRIRNEYGMADTLQEMVEFIPYWENTAFVSDNPNIKVSYYDKIKEQELYTSYDISKKYMVIVSNLQFNDSELKVSLPKGMKKVKVREMQSQKEIPLKNNKIEYRLSAYDYAIFEVTGELDEKRGSW